MNHNLHLDERFSLAADKLAANELDLAETLYAELLGEYSDNIGLRKRFINVLLQQDKYQQAIPYLERLIELKPDDAHAHYIFGMVMQKIGTADSAMASFLRALECRQDFVEAHTAMSTLSLPGEHYYQILRHVQAWLKPINYVEIGVDTGKSMAFANAPTICIGIDPQPKIRHRFSAPVRIFTETSDDFFAKHDLRAELGGQTVDLAFIDGLHLFEAALKDFVNIERYSSDRTVVLIHDCIPLDKLTSERERTTVFWSGDTWKIIPCLKRYRPDLTIINIAAPPTGLAVIMGLDPESSILRDHLDTIIEEYAPLDYEYLGRSKYEMLNVSFEDWPAVHELIQKMRVH